uniref:Complement factor I n=1 Tax=Varanus komodoensis TaxID=61221 RepID=A0A8D2L1C6_VARKO
MKLLSVLGLNLCLSLILAQKFLHFICRILNYTQNSCEKVFCLPWQRCVGGSCMCKIPYQCPRNGTSVCSTDKKTFQNYCQLKSLECQRNRGKFMNRGNCNPQDSFHLSLASGNTSSEGIVEAEINHGQKIFYCGRGWGMKEANVACRNLGFPEGADSTELVEPDGVSRTLECLSANCRGTETSLAECAVIRLVPRNEKLAKVVCHEHHRVCSPGEFFCVNGKCIPSEKTCNGIDDCGDLSDEVCCRACRAGSFHCKSDVCIPKEYLCNNEIDCLTGEDESQQLCNHPKVPGILTHDHGIRKKIKMLLPQLHCGVANSRVSRRKRIVGGINAQMGEFPWQVAIRDQTGRINCGGVYIGGCWVLTAAHCIRQSHLKTYRIYTGLLSAVIMTGQIDTYPIDKIIIHENYNSETSENGIALLKMVEKRIHFACSSPGLVPLCVPWSKYMFKDGHRCQVAGWGLDEGSRRQFNLKWGYVSLMGNCSDIYRERFFEGMECAGTHDGSVDACQGDSGGPLICFDSRNIGYVWGIVSRERCGKRGHPSIYIKVANYFDWIGHHTGFSVISRHNV